jgi:hypothetical protein
MSCVQAVCLIHAIGAAGLCTDCTAVCTVHLCHYEHLCLSAVVHFIWDGWEGHICGYLFYCGDAALHASKLLKLLLAGL